MTTKRPPAQPAGPSRGRREQLLAELEAARSLRARVDPRSIRLRRERAAARRNLLCR